MADILTKLCLAGVAVLFTLAAHVAGKSEGLFVLPLDAECRALATPVLVSLGTETTTAIQPSAVFAEALKAGAEEIIVAHNHPSGDQTPSKADIAATKELKDRAARLKVGLLDHLIVNASSPAFRSLAEEGVV